MLFPYFTNVGMSYVRLTGYFTHQCLGLAYDSLCVGSIDPKEGFFTKTEESPPFAARWGQSVTDFTRKVTKGPFSVHFVFPITPIHPPFHKKVRNELIMHRCILLYHLGSIEKGFVEMEKKS